MSNIWKGNFPKPRTPKYQDSFMGRNPWTQDIREDSIQVPSVNVMEHKNTYILEVIAPGMSKSDYQISVDDGVLNIKAEKHFENGSDEEAEENAYTHREYRYTSFQRSFSIPETLDDEKIAARCQDGVLKITIPKRENVATKKPRQISIS